MRHFSKFCPRDVGLQKVQAEYVDCYAMLEKNVVIQRRTKMVKLLVMGSVQMEDEDRKIRQS